MVGRRRSLHRRIGQEQDFGKHRDMNVNELMGYVNSISTSSEQTSSVKASSVSGTQKLSEEQKAELTKNFKELLDKQVEEVSENAELIEALNGTVIAGRTDLQDLSMDMLKTSGGQRLLSELVNGQFASIVTTDAEEHKENKNEDVKQPQDVTLPSFL